MREFKVKFVKGFGEHAKLLNGVGTIAISDDEVVLTRSEIRGWLWNTPAETVTVSLNQIANIGENQEKKCVQFSQYQANHFNGTPENVFLFSMLDESEKDELLELLPKQVSEEVAMEMEFNEKLIQLTPFDFFTFAIVAICAIVYVFMGILCGFESLTKPSLITLLRFGADFGPLVADGEWQRIITSAFVHIGVVHILFNMIILWQIGSFVERLYGNLLFLVVYLGSAVAGSLMSLSMNPIVISAGASGAIFGLYGALLAYMLRRKGAIPLHMVSGIRNGAIAFIVFNLIFGMQAGIDNWCHLGGLLGGFFLGAIVAPPFESEERSRYSLIMAIFGAAIVVAGTFWYLSSNPIKLEKDVIGNTLAELGSYYYDGNSELHIEKDVNTGIDYFNRAVKYNNPDALYSMGILYYNGDGVEKDEDKALDLFKQAAEMGNPDAQSEYGRILYVDKESRIEGFKWLNKACENGSQMARLLIACIYYDGDEIIKPNQEFAIREFKELTKMKFQPAIEALRQLEENKASDTPNPKDESAPEDEPAPVENGEPEEN